jgi:hypothetical protein
MPDLPINRHLLGIALRLAVPRVLNLNIRTLLDHLPIGVAHIAAA